MVGGLREEEIEAREVQRLSGLAAFDELADLFAQGSCGGHEATAFEGRRLAEGGERAQNVGVGLELVVQLAVYERQGIEELEDRVATSMAGG